MARIKYPNSARVAAEKKLREHGHILEKVDTFKCIDRILYFYNNDWTAIDRNLHRYGRKWRRLYGLLGREGDYTRTSGRFYVMVVQSVMIFG